MIVISNPTAIANEIPIIHALFEQGLAFFHIRKPDYTTIEMKKFATAIGLEYAHKMVLHSHHQLAEELVIKRIHFTENHRKTIMKQQLEYYKQERYTLSTSAHCIEDFNDLDSKFDYAFLSPVYGSISKHNYTSKTNLLKSINDRTNFQTKMIALGGMDASTITTTLKAGFDSIALLGTIWNSKDPIQNFKLCQQIALSF